MTSVHVEIMQYQSCKTRTQVDIFFKQDEVPSYLYRSVKKLSISIQFDRRYFENSQLRDYLIRNERVLGETLLQVLKETIRKQIAVNEFEK